MKKIIAIILASLAVLSLSSDGATYHDFYLDKSVKINGGIFFSVYPFQEHASIRIASPSHPITMDSHPINKNLHIHRKLDIRAIYTMANR